MISRPPLTPCLICEKAIVYLWSENIIAGSDATNLSSACDIYIYAEYGSNFDTSVFAATICDECLDKAIQSKKVRTIQDTIE